MSLLGLESVTFGIDDVAAESRFLEDFGLSTVDKGAAGADLACSEGAFVHVRSARDAALPAPATPALALRQVVWGVSDAGALAEIGADLGRDRDVAMGADGVVRTTDPSGLAVGFAVTAVDRSAERWRDANASRPAGDRATIPDRARPSHFGHVVLEGSTPEVEEFYRDRLGFRVSDWNPRGVFLRCDGATNHHNLLLMSGGPLGLHHISFRVSGIDEIMVGKERLDSLGWRSVWGPGRHPIGSQLFCYFRNPAGGLIEYHADEDCIVDSESWTPRRFDARDSMAWGGLPDVASV